MPSLVDAPRRGRPRKHLQGAAYFVVYLPAMFVAVCCELLFVAAVERYLYSEAA
jgi:hypothetical protein